MAPCEVFLPACTLHNEPANFGVWKDNSCMQWNCKGSKSMPASPCNRLLDDYDIQLAKLKFFEPSDAHDNYVENSMDSYTPKIVDSINLPFKSPCAAYFDGCDDYGLASISDQCNTLSMAPLSTPECSPDSAPCISSNNSMIHCATIVGVCYVQPQPLEVASRAQKGLRARLSSTIEYSYDTLTSKCEDSGMKSVVSEREPLKLLELIKTPNRNLERFMNGKVWHMSQDVQGCREVQKALDGCQSAPDRESAAAQLMGHVWEAMRCPHANHVLRKFIQIMPSSMLDFVVLEIVQDGAAGVKLFASHRYGCRIIEEVLSTCRAEQLDKIMEHLLTEAEGLCTHMYGNFVMKALLRHSSLLQRQKIVQILLGNAVTMGTNFYACAIMAHVLQSRDDQSQALARALVSHTGLLSAMACHKHGRAAGEAVLLVLEGAERQVAVNEMALPPLKIMKASRTSKN